MDCEDWGVTLVTSLPVPEGLSHVGVRAHYFRVVDAGEKPAETDADARPAKKMLAKTKETGLVVEARDMSFTYEDGKAPVMSHVSFKAQPGEILAFVGPSGGGKTTMLRLMLGLLRPQDGTLTVRLEDGSSELPVSDSTPARTRA